MQDLKNLNSEELKQFLVRHGKNSFHAQQIFTWVYKKGIHDFKEMSDLSSGLRRQLKENFSLATLELIKAIKSQDGTEKFLFALKDGNFIEGVIIPAEKRVTACVSTHAGCKFNCRFCASGLLGFKRNLICAEIIDEILYLKDNSKDKKLTHLVFMGIGEPLDNYDNLVKAIRIINSPYSLNIGARRITISTCGIVPGIKKLIDEHLQVELSISLHAADDKTRDFLMPINKKYPIKELIYAASEYTRYTNRQITFEYILIKGINSHLQDAQKLSIILRNLNCKVNLIPCNRIKELKIEPPGKLEILFFRDKLAKSGINVTLRRPRGEDIQAACGQLRLRHERE